MDRWLAQSARALFGPDHPTTIYALNLASASIMADASQEELDEAREVNKAGAYQPEPPDAMGGAPGFAPKIVGKPKPAAKKESA